MVSRGGEHDNNKGDNEFGQSIVWVDFEKVNIKRIVDSLDDKLIQKTNVWLILSVHFTIQKLNMDHILFFIYNFGYFCLTIKNYCDHVLFII